MLIRSLLILIMTAAVIPCIGDDGGRSGNNSYPRIGIALSGGGIRGVAHLGVLRRLEEEGIKPYMISGSSMGALIGGLYCLGYNTYEIESMIKESQTEEVFTNKPERDMTENYIKKTSDRTVVELELTDSGIEMPNALNNGHNVLKKIRTYAGRSPFNSDDFDELKYRLRIVCSDIQNSTKVVFREGNLPLIITASMSFPGLFKPVKYGNMLLLDGGLTDNVPVSVLQDCDFIIASNTTHDTPSDDNGYNFIELLDRISVLMTKNNIEASIEKADILIRPEVDKISVTELNDPDSLVMLGYKEADKAIVRIREILGSRERGSKDDADVSEVNGMPLITGVTLFGQDEISKAVSGSVSVSEFESGLKELYISRGYVLCSTSILKGDPDTLKVNEGVVRRIRIGGDHSTRKSFIRDEISVSAGRILRLDDLESSVDNLYGTGLFYKVNYELNRDSCEVTFRVEEKPYNLIRLGANYQTDRGFLGLVELANKNLYGKRAELYGGVTFGESMNRAEMSYYNPFLKRSTLFLEIMPYYQIKERNFYGGEHDRIISLTYDEERYGAEVNLGFQFFDNYQGMFSLVHEYVGIDDETDSRTSGIFRVLADSRDDHIVPSKGVYFEWNIESGIYNFDDGSMFQKTWWEFSAYTRTAGVLNVGIGIGGGTGDNLVPYAERYLAGGINSMPGTFFEEYVVLQYFNLKNTYDLLLKKSPFFDLYLSAGYYLNALWSNEPEIEINYRDFINSFYAGMILNTKLAPVEAGVGLTAGNGTIRENMRLFLSVGYPLQ